MDTFWRIVIETFERFYGEVVQFLPNLIVFVFILTMGVFSAVVVKFVALWVFRAINLDGLSERTGMSQALQKGGIKETASVLVSRFAGWFILIVFIIISIGALRVPTMDMLFERSMLYLPNVFVAALILFVGYLLGNFLGRAALIASVNAGIRASGLVGKFVKHTILLLSVTMALEQLKIGKGTVVIAFAVIFGGVVLALAIAFGLGGRDIARAYLEKKVAGEKKDEISHL